MRELSIEEVSSVAGAAGICSATSLGNIICGFGTTLLFEAVKRVYVKATEDDGLGGVDVTGYAALADAGISA